MSGRPELDGVLKKANPNTIQDKFLVGYQAWFTCGGDGKPVHTGHHGWLHWLDRPIPDGGKVYMDVWPDTSDYDDDELYDVPGMTMQDGSPAKLFSSRNPKTVQRHLHWMARHAVDGLFLQRFGSQLEIDGNTRGGKLDLMRLRDEITNVVFRAAEKENRVVAIQYDISGVPDDRMLQTFQVDWIHLMRDLRVTDSPAYLREKGKPVIAIYGFGFLGKHHNPDTIRAVLGFLRKMTPGGAYILGGIPSNWAASIGDADPDPRFVDLFLNEFDCLSPWAVGRFHTEDAADWWAEKFIKRDMKMLKENEDKTGRHVDYAPVILPGYSHHNGRNEPWNMSARAGGHFLWRQVWNARREGVRIMYGAMWDEYDEGTAYLPIATSKRLLPREGHFMALDEDGYDLPADWFMRISGMAGETLRGERLIHETFPIKELQDYWSTRPHYEAERQGDGGEGSSSGATPAGFSEWLSEQVQKEEAEQLPPPPYTLEAAAEAEAAASAAEQSSSSPAPNPNPNPPPQPSLSTRPSLSSRPLPAQLPVPPLNVNTRPVSQGAASPSSAEAYAPSTSPFAPLMVPQTRPDSSTGPSTTNLTHSASLATRPVQSSGAGRLRPTQSYHAGQAQSYPQSSSSTSSQMPPMPSLPMPAFPQPAIPGIGQVSTYPDLDHDANGDGVESMTQAFSGQSLNSAPQLPHRSSSGIGRSHSHSPGSSLSASPHPRPDNQNLPVLGMALWGDQNESLVSPHSPPANSSHPESRNHSPHSSYSHSHSHHHHHSPHSGSPSRTSSPPVTPPQAQAGLSSYPGMLTVPRPPPPPQHPSSSRPRPPSSPNPRPSQELSPPPLHPSRPRPPSSPRPPQEGAVPQPSQQGSWPYNAYTPGGSHGPPPDRLTMSSSPVPPTVAPALPIHTRPEPQSQSQSHHHHGPHTSWYSSSGPSPPPPQQQQGQPQGFAPPPGPPPSHPTSPPPLPGGRPGPGAGYPGMSPSSPTHAPPQPQPYGQPALGPHYGMASPPPGPPPGPGAHYGMTSPPPGPPLQQHPSYGHGPPPSPSPYGAGPPPPRPGPGPGGYPGQGGYPGPGQGYPQGGYPGPGPGGYQQGPYGPPPPGMTPHPYGAPPPQGGYPVQYVVQPAQPSGILDSAFGAVDRLFGGRR